MKTKIYALLLIVALLMTGCSKSSEVLETIPADAQVVAHLNLAKFFDAAGIKINGDKVDAPANLQSMFGAGNLSKIAGLSKAVDVKSLYVYQRPGAAELIFVAPLNDRKALEALLEDDDTKKGSADGFDCYSVDGILTVLAKDNLCWMMFTQATSATAVVADALKASEERSIAEICGSAEALGGGDLCNVFVPASGDVGMAIKINTEGEALVGEGCLVGNKEKIDSMVNSSLVVTIGDKRELMAPDKPLLLIAGGFNPQFDWTKTIETVTAQVGFDYAAVIKSIQPICEQLDGPAIVWAQSDAPVTALLENPLPNIKGKIDASVKDGGAVVLKDYFGNMMSSLGLVGKNTGDKVVYSNGPLSLEIAGVANRFEMTLGNVAGIPLTNHTPRVKDYNCVAMINIPTLSGLLAGGKSYGFSFELKSKADKASFKLSFPGSGAGVIPTLLSF